MESKEEIKLTEDQQEAWDKLESWLKTTNRDPVFILRGYAGTGKSFLMKKLRSLPYSFLFSAPTNKATHVLSTFLGEGAATSTIYSLLAMRMTEVEDKMELTFSETGVTKLGLVSSNIIVIDEAGMLQSVVLKVLKEAQKHFGFSIIFVGDPAQLPPVDELTSRAWSWQKDPSKRAMLKKVMRFDSYLLHVATLARQAVIDYTKTGIDNNFQLPKKSVPEEGYFTFSSREEMIADILKVRTKPSDFASTKVLAWTNKAVYSYNRSIRKSLGFKEEFEVGDLLLLSSPIKDPVDGTVAFPIDTEATVIDVSLIPKVFETSAYADEEDEFFPPRPISLYVFQLGCEGLAGNTLYVPQSKDNELVREFFSKYARFIRTTKLHRERKNFWKDFWNLKSQLNSVRYNYALTCHRSQGSTYDNSYVDQPNILRNSEVNVALRCLYVASTRSSKTLSVLNL